MGNRLSGNRPSEYNDVTCACGKDLPTSKTRSSPKHRINGSSTYYCPQCFGENELQRRNDESKEKMKEQQQKRREEERRKQEELEYPSQLQRRRRKQKLLREEEAERSERLQIQSCKLPNVSNTATFLDSKGSTDSKSDDEYSIVEKCIERVYDSESDDEFLEDNKTPQMHIEYMKTIELGDDNDDQAKQEMQVDLSSESKISTQTTVETLFNTVWLIKPDDHIDAEQLEDVQLFMLSEYATRNGLTSREIRQEVSEKIASEPKKWSKLIICRKRLEEIKGGKQLAMIGAGRDDFNLDATIIPETYSETVDGKTVTTKYNMKNGVATQSTRTYDKKIKVHAVKDKREKTVTNEVRMTSIEANVTGLMFVGKRAPHTQSIPGMIRRYIGENKGRIITQDSEVAFHGAPSCAGMGAGQGYATTLITSKKYNDREKTNWTGFKKTIGKGHKFSLRFEAKTDRITNIGNAEEYIKKIYEKRESDDLVDKSNAEALKERLALMEKVDPRIHRVKSYDYCYKEGTEILNKGSMGEDFELGVPKRFNEPHQPAELKDEFTKATKKVKKHIINKVPTYTPSK